MSKRTTTAFDKRLGRRLREARLLRGQTQQQLAEILGISWQQLQKNELGENRVNAERLYIVSKELDMSLGYFLGGDDEDIGAKELSDEALRLAGQIEALPDKLIRYSVSTLVSSISRAWDRRETR